MGAVKPILYGLAIAMLLVCGCHKKKVIYSEMPQGLKDYFAWNRGSYWIFTDAITGSRDSFSVVDHTLRPASETYDRYSDDYAFQVIKITIKEFYTVSIDSYRTWTLQVSSKNNKYTSQLNSKTVVDAGYFTEGWPFMLTSNVGNVKRVMLPEIEVNGKTYSDVYSTITTYNAGQYDQILMNADSGLITIKLDNGYAHQALELERCNLVR